MHRQKVLRTCLTICLATLMHIMAAAQNAADLYSQGMAKYNSGNYKAAITLFEKSMFVDGSSANKSKCNDMIGKCRKKMAEPSLTKVRKTARNTDSPYPDGWDEQIIDATPNKEYSKFIHPKGNDWSFTIKSDEEWLEATKREEGGDKKLVFSCGTNNGSDRKAVVVVMHDGKSYPINVTQKGYGNDDNSGRSTSEHIGYTPIGAKDTYLLISGLKAPKPEVISMPSWFVKKLDHKLKEPNFFQKVLSFFGIKTKRKHTGLEDGEAAFQVQPNETGELRDSVITFKGLGTYRIAQEN